MTRIPHPVKGWIPNIETPLRLDRTPAVTPVAAPAVGQHTEQILRDVLCYDSAQIDSLRDAGAFTG